MGNLIRSIATYAFLTALLAVTVFGMAMMRPVPPTTYPAITPADDWLHLGEDGLRRFYADPLSTLPGYATGMRDPEPGEDCRRPTLDGPCR